MAIEGGLAQILGGESFWGKILSQKYSIGE